MAKSLPALLPDSAPLSATRLQRVAPALFKLRVRVVPAAPAMVRASGPALVTQMSLSTVTKGTSTTSPPRVAVPPAALKSVAEPSLFWRRLVVFQLAEPGGALVS